LVIALTMTALAAFGCWYAGQLKDLNAWAVQVGEQRRAGRHGDLEVPTRMPENGASTAVRESRYERAPAPLPLESGGYLMSVLEVEIGPVRINNFETPTRHLTVRIDVSNLSGQPVEYRGWHDARSYCTLKGPLNGVYHMLRFEGSELPEGCVRTVRLPPRGTVRDMIVFEDRDLAAIASLQLELPPRSPVAPQPVQFTIPGSKIRRGSAPSLGMGSTSTPSATPYPPVARRGVSEAERIRAEAERKWDSIEKAARRKSRTNLVDFYKRERVKIRGELSNKYQIDRDELNRIVPYLFKQ
jgi:hypothetical protein